MVSKLPPPLFDPTSLGLPADFKLTAFAERKGWGCKVKKEQLIDFLEGVGDGGMLSEDSPDVSLIPIEGVDDVSGDHATKAQCKKR